MRKTLIAILLGVTALAAAACGNSGSSSNPAGESLAPGDSVESTMPVESPAESPSDMLESPASS